MAFQYEVEEKPGYLCVHVLGERSREAVISLAHELAAKVLELQQQRLLIDVRDFEGLLQAIDSYEIVNLELPRFREKVLKKAVDLRLTIEIPFSNRQS